MTRDLRYTHPYLLLLERAKQFVGFAFVIGLGLAVQVWAALQWRANFVSDEAVFGLMARHTLQGRPPTYMYGIRYLGSLEALLSAGFIHLFGSGVLSLRMSSLVLFGVFLILHGISIYRSWGGRVALISLLVLALPGPVVLYYTFRPIGAFGAMFVFGTSALLLSQAQVSQGRFHYLRMVALGMVMGLGLWSHPMTIVYFFTLGIVYWLETPEWSALHKRLYEFCERVVLMSSRELLLVIAWSLIGLIVVAFFTAGCEPQTSFTTAQNIARILLLGVGGALGLSALLVSSRCKEFLLGGLSLLSGFVLGNFPQWKAWLFFGVAPSTAVFPSCPTEVLPRVTLVVEQLVPAMWGTLSLTNIPYPSQPQIDLSTLVLLIMLVALGIFIWTERTALSSLAVMSPLSQADGKATIFGLLFGLPLILATLGSNTVDVYSVRYLLVAWQASSVILALFLSRLATRFRMLSAVLLGLCVLQVGIVNLVHVGELWSDRSEWYSPEAISTLEEFLTQNKVQGGYADYWFAYTLDFLTEERVTFAPYNCTDRYPAYSERVVTLPLQAYLFWPGAMPAEASQADDIARELRLKKGAGPAFPWILERVGKQVVLERRRVSNWDVWLLSDQYP